MSDKWVTIAEAAAALKVHPRTVERQLKSGKLQSRRTDGGQLEVQIDVPESQGLGAEALSVVAGQAENQVQLALGATSTLVKTSQEDARLARLDAERAWDETRIARRGSVVAWSVVGVMAVAMTVAVGWTSSALTRSQVELAHETDQVKTVSDTAGQLAAERDNLREKLAAASEARSRAEGELNGRVAADNSTMALAIRKQSPATQPTGLFERLASLFATTSSDVPGKE